MKTRIRPLVVAGLAAALLGGALSGCAPLVVGGAAVGTALVSSDRRSAGTQLDDENIERKAANRIREAFGDRVHINVNAYNRQVLLTGEVPGDSAKQQIEQIVSALPGVRNVFNETAVLGNTTLGQRSSDGMVTTKVRASLVDAADLQASAFKVVTERGTVFLMGMVTAKEADRATQIARNISGAQRVVRVMEVISDDDLRRIQEASR